MKGQYTDRLCIIISDEKSRAKLDEIGDFGENLETVKKRSDDRLGPTSRQILDLNLDTTNNSISILTLPEAFYLSHALKCLTITRSEPQEILDLESQWNIFREDYGRSNIIHDFAIEYAVYHHFRISGWIVKSGTNYGTNFLLYNKGPTLDHAKYAVIIMNEVDDPFRCSLTWQSVLTFHRVAQSVCKELLLVFVTLPQDSVTILNLPDCIEKLQIVTRVFSSTTKVSSLL